MKSTVVPAQITTVEDKIAGSLSFVQIILLVFSLIIGTAFYGLIPPKLHISGLKIALVLIQFSIFGILALRYQGRILADWLVIYLRWKARPRVYIFDKNDAASRNMEQIIATQKQEKEIRKSAHVKTSKKIKQVDLPLFDNSGSIISVKPSKKGGLDVEYLEV